MNGAYAKTCKDMVKVCNLYTKLLAVTDNTTPRLQ